MPRNKKKRPLFIRPAEPEVLDFQPGFSKKETFTWKRGEYECRAVFDYCLLFNAGMGAPIHFKWNKEPPPSVFLEFISWKESVFSSLSRRNAMALMDITTLQPGVLRYDVYHNGKLVESKRGSAVGIPKI